jgi:hypothetical protein
MQRRIDGEIMLERTLVQSRGFRNIEENGRVVGFEFLLRIPNYRGMRASLIDGVDVSVDGEKFSYEDNVLVIQGNPLTLSQLREAATIRWALQELATVRVAKAGGLTLGVHDVEVAVRMRPPYFPLEMQPWIVSEMREATIVL